MLDRYSGNLLSGEYMVVHNPERALEAYECLAIRTTQFYILVSGSC